MLCEDIESTKAQSCVYSFHNRQSSEHVAYKAVAMGCLCCHICCSNVDLAAASFATLTRNHLAAGFSVCKSSKLVSIEVTSSEGDQMSQKG